MAKFCPIWSHCKAIFFHQNFVVGLLQLDRSTDDDSAASTVELSDEVDHSADEQNLRPVPAALDGVARPAALVAPNLPERSRRF